MNHLRARQQQETTSTLLKAQLENSSKLSEETRDELRQQQEANEFGAHTQIELFKKQSLDWYVNYKEPLESVKDVSNDHQRELKILLDEMVAKQALNAREGNDVESSDFLQTYHSLLSKREAYTVIGDSYFKVCLRTGEIGSSPLINPHKFDITDFEKYIVYGTHSKAIHLLATLQKFIRRAEDLGLTRESFTEILRELIVTYLPEHSSVISFLNTPHEVFKAIVNTVNYDTLKEQVHKAIKKIKREVGESIELPLGIYRSLIIEASMLENPKAKERDVVKKADKACTKTAMHLVEPNLAKEIEHVKTLFLVNLPDKKFEYSELIAFVNKAEQKEQYRLKSTKQLVDKTVSFTVFQMDHYAPMGDFIQNFNRCTMDAHPQQHQENTGYRGYQTNSQMRSRRDQWNNQKPSYDFRRANETNNPYRQSAHSKYATVPTVPPHKSPFVPGTRYAPTPTRDADTSAKPDTTYASTSAASSQRGGTPSPTRGYQSPSYQNGRNTSPGYSSGGRPYGHQVHANERAQTPPAGARPRSATASVSPVRRSTSSSPVFYRTRSGRHFPRNPNKRYPYDTKWYIRTRSGNNFKSRERKNSKGRYERTSPRRRQSCRMCGSRDHSKPASLDRVSSIPKNKRCPYINMTQQKTPCNKCRRGLLHPSYACVSAGRPRMSSQVNNVSTEEGFNPDLN